MKANITPTPNAALKLDAASRASLFSISKWSKVLAAVVFFVFCMRLFITLEQGVWNTSESREVHYIVFRLLVDVLWFFFGLLILLFSVKLDKALKMKQQPLLTAAFTNLNTIFKITGIFGLIMVFSYVVLELIVNRS